MAADHQTNYAQQAVFGARKIRRLAAGTAGHALIAASGNGGVLNLMAQHLEVKDGPVPNPSPTPSSATVELMRDWAGVIASAATEICAGSEPPLTCASDQHSSASMDGALLLGHGGQLFYLFTHQAAHVADGVAALGSGAELALGAMHVALERGATPEDAVRDGVRLACRFITGCGLDGTDPLIESIPVRAN